MLLLFWACALAPSSDGAASDGRLPAGSAPDGATSLWRTPATRESFDALATRVEVVVRDPAALDPAIAATRAACARVEQVANEWRPDSPLAAVTRAAGNGEKVPIPDDLAALLARSVALSRATSGAFDPTWAALWHTWQLGPAPVLPRAETVAGLLPLVDVEGLELGEGWARLTRPGMALGLGAIAKGWALDRAAEALLSVGILDFSLSAGGQVRVEGHPSEGQPWRVGLRAPRGGPDETFAALAVTGGSVSTSGDYERYVDIDGRRYSHILDPRTGWPAAAVRSATVVAPDGTTADALSTAIFVLGAAEGIALATATPGVEAVLVGSDGTLHLTPGALGLLEDLDAAMAAAP